MCSAWSPRGPRSGVTLYGHGIETSFFFFFLSCFSGLHPQHVEVPRLGVKLDLQAPAYTTATATPDPSHVFNLHHSPW